MPEISLSNSKGRDAQVMAESVRSALSVRWIDRNGRQASSVRLLRGTLACDADVLISQSGGLDKVSQSLIDGDPEIDLEQVGMVMRETSRVFVNTDREIVHAVHQWEIVRNPDGTERQRRPKKISASNVTPEQPLRWSGKLLPKTEVFNKFVMASKLQIVHVNGLTYDFLFEMAKELESKNSLLLMGAGPKSNLPLILRRGAVAYRGFLEGRTRGEQYCLLLHLSNMELKAPEVAPETEGSS